MKIFKRYYFRKLFFSLQFSSKGNGRCFFQRRNFPFSLSGEATAIAKSTPNLRKTYGKKNSLSLLSTSSRADHPLEITATSPRAPGGFFVNIKGETKGSDSQIIYRGEV